MDASTTNPTVYSTPEQTHSRKLEDMPAAIMDYIKHNPKQTTFLVANGVVFFAPALVFGPLLALLGFTGSGVAAGSAAAGMQASIGAVRVGSFFASAQSAAMGGYGIGLFGGVVKGVCFVAAGVGGLFGGGGDEVTTDGDVLAEGGEDGSDAEEVVGKGEVKQDGGF